MRRSVSVIGEATQLATVVPLSGAAWLANGSASAAEAAARTIKRCELMG
jgi:hypothetical protein